LRIDHLNCGSLRPYIPAIDSLVYCLLAETDDGLMLVDTGFGIQDYTAPTRLVRLFTALMRSPRDLAETAAYQVERRGHARRDVRHIVMTHLHIDHAGGLPDFPDARVHAHRLEHEAAMRPKGLIERFYISEHWAHGPQWVLHDQVNTEWYGFQGIEIIPGLSPGVILLPLPGHSRGHCGVAVETEYGWLLHCGDATYPFYHRDHPDQPFRDPPGWLVSRFLGPHTPRLKALFEAHRDEVWMVSSHDLVSFQINTGGQW
jgi:glyoxylase-like metal-dependent hydrolase (beta-lactamase superfamily II)